MDQQQALGYFLLLVWPSGPGKTEQGGQLLIGDGVQAGGPPAEQGGGEAEARQGMPQILGAIAKGPHAVLPGFPPCYAAQSHQESATAEILTCRPPELRGQRCPVLYGMMVRVVVEDTAPGAGKGGEDEMALGWVEIAARWVHPE